MKRNLKISLIAALLIASPILMLAQPPHPNNGGAPTGSNTKVGDQPSAPVGNGTLILLTLAVAYFGRKVYGMRTEKVDVK